MPEPWVLHATHLVPPRAPIVDIACGGGRHARWFLANDHQATLIDRDVSAVADLRNDVGATIVSADLESSHVDILHIIPPARFGGVIVVNFLWRPLMSAIVEAVAPGGVLIYQTFAVGNARHGKPSNPDYLLRPGELLDAVSGRLEVLRYEHGEDLLDRPVTIQRIVARRPE